MKTSPALLTIILSACLLAGFVNSYGWIFKKLREMVGLVTVLLHTKYLKGSTSPKAFLTTSLKFYKIHPQNFYARQHICNSAYILSPIHLSVCPSVCVFICLSVCMCACVHVFVCRSVEMIMPRDASLSSRSRSISAETWSTHILSKDLTTHC